MTDAQKAGELLTEEQLNFIRAEFGHDRVSLLALSDDDFENLYDRIGDIEVAETLKANDGELSKRGKMAESIITIVGNELYMVGDEIDSIEDCPS